MVRSSIVGLHGLSTELRVYIRWALCLSGMHWAQFVFRLPICGYGVDSVLESIGRRSKIVFCNLLFARFVLF